MMSKRRAAQAAGAILGAAAVTVLAIALTRDKAMEVATVTEPGPAAVVPIEGTSLSSVTLDRRAAERIGLRLMHVRAHGRRTVVPYSSLLYDRRGATWVYTSPSRLTFVRARVTVEVIRESSAILAEGPSVGTLVVAVGAAELLGTEFGVGH